MLNIQRLVFLGRFSLSFWMMFFFDIHAAEEVIYAQSPRIKKQFERIVQNDQLHKERKRVVILGAGIAGLTAAYELVQLGHTVEIIEASNRVGGRIWTHTFKSTGEYGELGAMRVPAGHDYTHHYIEVARLTSSLRPFITAFQNVNCFYHFRGQTPVRIKDANSFINKEYHLSPYERETISAAPPPEILRVHLENATKLLRSKSPITTSDIEEEEKWGGLFGTTFLNDYARELEGLTLGEFLKQRLESKDARELIGASTGLELWWDKAVSMFLREGITQTGEGLKEIAGGFSRLPENLADMLRKKEVKIRLNTEVTSIEISPTGPKVNLRTRPTDPSMWDSPPTNKHSENEEVDFVICTIPFGVLRMMDLKGFSSLKMEAIRNLSYASSSKVLLHFKDRFWERGSHDMAILGGASMSDQITRCTYYPSDHAKIIPTFSSQRPKEFSGVFTVSDPLTIERAGGHPLRDEPIPGVLLGSYNWGQDAIRLGTLPPLERVEVVLAELEKFHPTIRENLHPTEGHMSMFWDSYRWSRGAFCGMRPNDMREYHHVSKQPEGNVFFAGEHCSLDPGWIQGAIKSALDAVEGVVKAKPLH